LTVHDWCVLMRVPRKELPVRLLVENIFWEKDPGRKSLLGENCW
jgi:hypothetical protein